MSLIEVRGLCKSFDGLSVLRNVDLTVEEGERIAVIGGSGCGKSVFLRSIEMLERPDAGQISIAGQEITARGADVDRLRRSMGMVFQLDPSMVGEVQAVIRMLAKRGMTMLIVTHEMSFAREVATRVLFMADHGIYEEGTPEQIFDAPQKEKTAAFIRKIKNLSYVITERSFDLMELQGAIQLFGEKYGLDRNHIYRLQICCEELIYEMLAHCYEDAEPVELHLDIDYAELDRTAEIELVCGGSCYDPFAQAEDGLGVTILKHMGRSLTHAFAHGSNRIRVRM